MLDKDGKCQMCQHPGLKRLIPKLAIMGSKKKKEKKK